MFCVSKTRQYPKYGESGKRFALSFRKKAGGQSENFAALLHKPPSRPPFGYAVIKRGWISPCGGAGGAISPLQNKKAGGTPRRSQSLQKKAISPYWEQNKIKKVLPVQEENTFLSTEKKIFCVWDMHHTAE